MIDIDEYTFTTSRGTFHVFKMKDGTWHAALDGYSWAGPFGTPDEAATALASGTAARARFDVAGLGIPSLIGGWVATRR
ncbi:hypothetical protein KY49_695 [Burkholderia sp. MSHR3999]|nr:hypothetical protein KY49_695 [Burkholderia sp. MSHR3999]